MLRFTLTGRALNKLVYVTHTVLMIEADRENASIVSCVIRDAELKRFADEAIAQGDLVHAEGPIEWFHTTTSSSACCYFHFAAETVVIAEEPDGASTA